MLCHKLSESPAVTIAKTSGRARGAGSELARGRLLGRGRAMEVILGADDFDAETAERYGWINRPCPTPTWTRSWPGWPGASRRSPPMGCERPSKSDHIALRLMSGARRQTLRRCLTSPRTRAAVRPLAPSQDRLTVQEMAYARGRMIEFEMGLTSTDSTRNQPS
jgi:enoyl-CoA hydratase/carnithine racemase